jgi:predicted acylesterase/phospholipase RssA
MSIPTIQLAFQGGGAKLVAMLPIAGAFRQAERDGLISIKRVSGTSAGAICAALVATQADFGAVRRFLIDHGPTHLSLLIPSHIARMAAKSKSRGKVGLLDLIRNPGMLKKVLLTGEPLLHNSRLKTFVNGVLAAGNADFPRLIEDCQVELIVTASDIVNSTGIRHERGDLITAVEDSCSLPVLLRSFGSLAQTHYVDGGLCDNLPIDCLINDNQSPIFAVYPDGSEGPRSNGNILSYFVSLLSASINHNVKRSIDMIGKPYRFGAATDVGLLDFDQAITKLANESWYKIAFDDALGRIASFSKSYGFTLAPSQSRIADSTDINQFRATLLNLTDPQPGQPHKFQCLKGKFVVRVNHDRRLSTESPRGRREPDTITRISQMKVLSDDVSYYRASVNVSEESIVPTIWSARNLTQKCDIPIKALSLSPGRLANIPMRHCLIEFVDHRKNLLAGDVIELQSTYAVPHGSDLRKLNMGQPDYFGFSNTTGVQIEEAELILVFPKSLGTFRLHPDDERSRGLTERATALDLQTSDNWMMEVGQQAVGIAVKKMPPEAALFATIVPA